MADVDVQRRGRTIWPWIIDLLVLALLIWALVEMFDSDETEVAVEEPVATAPVVPVQPVTPTVSGGLAIAEVMANPSAYVGQSFQTGTGRWPRWSATAVSGSRGTRGSVCSWSRTRAPEPRGRPSCLLPRKAARIGA